MVKRRKKKKSFKKIRKFFVELWKKVKGWFVYLIKQFLNLPKKIRYIIYVWSIVVLLIVIIIVASSTNNKYLSKYEQIEEDINYATSVYVREKALYPLQENKLKLDINVLIDENLMYDDDIKENKCEGFSVSYYDDKKEDYVINSYINCKKYTTRGYSDYK